MTGKLHTRKKRYLTLGIERNRKPRPKTFHSELEAKNYADRTGMKDYLIERMNYGLSKKFRLAKK